MNDLSATLGALLHVFFLVFTPVMWVEEIYQDPDWTALVGLVLLPVATGLVLFGPRWWLPYYIAGWLLGPDEEPAPLTRRESRAIVQDERRERRRASRARSRASSRSDASASGLVSPSVGASRTPSPSGSPPPFFDDPPPIYLYNPPPQFLFPPPGTPDQVQPTLCLMPRYRRPLVRTHRPTYGRPGMGLGSGFGSGTVVDIGSAAVVPNSSAGSAIGSIAQELWSSRATASSPRRPSPPPPPPSVLSRANAPASATCSLSRRSSFPVRAAQIDAVAPQKQQTTSVTGAGAVPPVSPRPAAVVEPLPGGFAAAPVTESFLIQFARIVIQGGWNYRPIELDWARMGLSHPAFRQYASQAQLARGVPRPAGLAAWLDRASENRRRQEWEAISERRSLLGQWQSFVAASAPVCPLPASSGITQATQPIYCPAPPLPSMQTTTPRSVETVPSITFASSTGPVAPPLASSGIAQVPAFSSATFSTAAPSPPATAPPPASSGIAQGMSFPIGNTSTGSRAQRGTRGRAGNGRLRSAAAGRAPGGGAKGIDYSLRWAKLRGKVTLESLRMTVDELMAWRSQGLIFPSASSSEEEVAFRRDSALMSGRLGPMATDIHQAAFMLRLQYATTKQFGRPLLEQLGSFSAAAVQQLDYILEPFFKEAGIQNFQRGVDSLQSEMQQVDEKLQEWFESIGAPESYFTLRSPLVSLRARLRLN